MDDPNYQIDDAEPERIRDLLTTGEWITVNVCAVLLVSGLVYVGWLLRGMAG